VPVAGGRLTSVRHPSHVSGVDGEARLEPQFQQPLSPQINPPINTHINSLRANEPTPVRQPSSAPTVSPAPDYWQGQSVVVRPILSPVAASSRRPGPGKSQRRLSIPVVIAAVIGALSFGVLTGFGGATRKPASVVVELDRMAELAGLGLNQVQLSGHRFTADAVIFDALELDRVRSLVSFNALAARERIEKLPWVETATITRLLPDTLAISITERKPFAVWQLGDRETLIDAAGRRLGGIRSGGAPDLPRVAGAGAPDVSAELFAHLANYPEITSRLVMAERVGQRRWTLHLAGDLEVLLPSNLDARPFKALQQMVGGRRLIDGGSGQLDLRHAERTIALPATRPSRLAVPNSRVKQNS
jgi:cell division protein FtsQ